MTEESKTQTNVHDDLDDLLEEVAGAHLPGYTGAAAEDEKDGDDDMAGLTATQKKRRKKKNKKKEKLMQEAAATAGRPSGRSMTREERMIESKR